MKVPYVVLDHLPLFFKWQQYDSEYVLFKSLSLLQSELLM